MDERSAGGGVPGVRRPSVWFAGGACSGSGFYITDYRSESYKKAAEAEKSMEERIEERVEVDDRLTSSKD